MSSTASTQAADADAQSRSEDLRTDHTAEAIPAGVDDVKFLPDPVSDQLVRVAMELGAALWVERRRTRTLERVLASAGVLTPDAVEQWVEEPADADADRKELEQWMKRIFGPLTHIGAANAGAGAEQ